MRGEIRNKAYVQVNDFSQMRWGNITPTDLDAMLDFGNKLFVFIELKHGDAQMPYGQRLALERLVDAIESIPAYLLIASHNTTSEKDVNTALATVTSYRYKKMWHIPQRAITVKEAVNVIRERELKEIL